MEDLEIILTDVLEGILGAFILVGIVVIVCVPVVVWWKWPEIKKAFRDRRERMKNP